MNNQKHALIGFFLAIGLFVYVLLVVFFLSHAERLFGKMQGLIAPATFLLLFVFSALVSGLLVLGYPLWLYFEGRKKEALVAFGSVVGWLFLLLVGLLTWRLLNQ
ncbi:MAG: hypothetical protein WCK11_03590 [Candidatus Falkowbacteria bacterium]